MYPRAAAYNRLLYMAYVKQNLNKRITAFVLAPENQMGFAIRTLGRHCSLKFRDAISFAVLVSA